MTFIPPQTSGEDFAPGSVRGFGKRTKETRMYRCPHCGALSTVGDADLAGFLCPNGHRFTAPESERYEREREALARRAAEEGIAGPAAWPIVEIERPRPNEA